MIRIGTRTIRQASLALLLTLPLAPAARADSDKVTFAIPAINTTAMFAFIARDQGFWKDQGLEVDPLQARGFRIGRAGTHRQDRDAFGRKFAPEPLPQAV